MAVPHASLISMVAVLLVIAAGAARADGAMALGERELFREGPRARRYCDRGGPGSPEECERVKTKVLSGFSYGRGSVSGGVAGAPSDGVAPRGVATAEAHAVSAALPGGTIELGSLDAALRGSHGSRARVTLVDSEALFFCRDAQTGELALPFMGMLARACEPTAVVGVDLGLFAMQWDLARPRMVSEWLRVGPAFELLGNGHSHQRLLRSIGVGLPFDLRTVDHGASDTAQTTLGAGLRIAALLRTPAWEGRLTARHRAALLGASPHHALEAELLVLHNFFLTDAVVVQAGVALRASWAERPADALSAWSSTAQARDAFAGLHLGWSHEPPDI